MPVDRSQYDETTSAADAPEADSRVDSPDPDAELLEEIRDRYANWRDRWAKIREHSQLCRKFLDGDPFDPEDRDKRKDAGMPAINHDELNQWINQAGNNVRQNKRGIKVQPGGGGSSEQTAKLRQDHIRAIEYRSHAPNVYATAFEQMLEGGYGYLRITRKYVNRKKGKEQEIVIKSIPNQDSVLFDPDCLEPDWSDARGVFVLQPMDRSEFRRKYPKARIVDFSSELLKVAKDWLTENQVLVAEYWRREGNEDEGFSIVEYLTNGVEILEKLPQPGEIIPIVPFIGKTRYIDEGGVSQRRIYSLVSFALEPQLTLAYLVSQELAEAGKSPKTPLKGWKGQFETDREALENLNSEPRAFIQFDYPQWAKDAGVSLQLPQEVSFSPNFEAFEIAKDSARRAIQAAIGSSPLPTAAQRNNEKSGVALERIRESTDIGNFHFADNHDRAVELTGRIVESWLAVTYHEEDRELALRRADDTHYIVKANTAEPYQNEAGELVHYPIGDDGVHNVEVAVGPSYPAQQQEAASFLDNLLGNLATLPIPDPQKSKLLALAIQMRQLGPKGDEMAEIISPTNKDLSPAAQAQLQAAAGQVQQQQALIQQLQAELLKLQNEKQARVVDNEYKVALEKMRIEAQAAAAEITTKAQNLEERLKFVEDLYRKLNIDQPHEMRVLAAEHVHDHAMAGQQQDADQQAAEAAAAQAPAPGADNPQPSA